jgi:activator of 2-hydroxyglutaryl-CoA dehydratase/predicted nucleotide-binding protein (sugar kinase/HSP70/actin superfamily)
MFCSRLEQTPPKADDMNMTTTQHGVIGKKVSDGRSGAQRFLGLDVGAETVKLVELLRDGEKLRVGHSEIFEHGKKPGPHLLELLPRLRWPDFGGAAVTGRFSTQLNLPRIPAKQALLRGYKFLFGDEPATIVNIGCHGFSVLELRANGLTVFRENSRCSQGTGNFLRQLVERFSLTVEEASALCADVPDPAPLSGRCPVILKTDMTHLANKGEDRAKILAGLFDAVCENVSVLIKPGISPARVLLTGGVSRSPRVRRVFAERLAKQGMNLVTADEEQLLCLEALGCALIAADGEPQINTDETQIKNSTGNICENLCESVAGKIRLPALENLLLPPRELKLERLPALSESLNRVRRMPSQPWAKVNGEFRRLVLGFDIGSTGSKVVALDLATRETVWEAYRQTLGDPVGAAQDLLRRFTENPAAKYPVVAFGATGSGREVAGSLLTSCYGKDAVFIVNEIVAHATGALHFDPRVDTIFEIGGQDAKYTRLAEGRIIDCAMNEACSAGTGSFIEEQGSKFSGIEDVQQLGCAAVAAPAGVSLGQHCSVFMAEVIDEAVSAGVEQPAIISGLYDSIIKNYLNRVKGNRSVGKVIFCQGMPFSADALAAAVARQTGSEVIVPPNPGTVGALGIALLAARELAADALAPLALEKFLGAKVEQKDTFVCGSTRGCGGAGNHCRIERLRTCVGDQKSNFTWGGGCALHDKGTRKRKLPDLAPDPFRERGELLKKLLAPLVVSRGHQRVAMSDEFMLKGLFPFFTAYFHAAGFDLEIVGAAGADVLKRGIQSANAPFCAPMQLFHGVAQQLAATGADWMFVPMIRSLPGAEGQRCSVVCPVVQGAPKVAERGLGVAQPPRMLSPLIDFGAGGFESKKFLASCDRLARELKLTKVQARAAWSAGHLAQREFDSACQESGRRTLEFCRAKNLVPVVVLGRDYTIYNQVLNSNVPAILREQGAIGIPVDCFPLDAETPLFNDIYWGYGQTILRAAHQVRRMDGVYALYGSNYSCGPDSFNLHFAAYAMAGKPFVVIETDGHSGDAGTRTRVEAFLHCVEEDRRAARKDAVQNDFENVQFTGLRLSDFQRRNEKSETLLVSHIGPASDAVAAVFRGLGFNAESIPAPDAESLRIGRRHTSGKECLPMPFTLGSLIQRLERATADEKFIYLMPSTDGPCRFGTYNLLNNIVLDRLGWRDRVRIWSPKDTGYFDDMPAGTEMLVFTGMAASDFLLQALFDVRPVERVRGETEKLFSRCLREMLAQIELAARGNLSLGAAVWQVAGGNLFGLREILQRAGRDFAALRGPGELPCVEMTGEIYVRGVDFSNDFLIKKLEARGLRVHLAPKTEWVNYCGYVQRQMDGRNRFTDSFSQLVRRRIENVAFAAMEPSLGSSPLPTTADALTEAEPYVDAALLGEAVLSVGAPLHEYRHGHIDAVVNVGPLECMPSKIAEAQWHHVTEREGVLSLTLAFNGDPVNTAALDNFAFEVKERFQARKSTMHSRRNGHRDETSLAENVLSGKFNSVHRNGKP